MKKIFSIFTLLVASAALLLSSCKDDETSSFALYGFNPNPGIRGEAVTFYGEGLNAVSSVVFTGGAEATDITRNGSSISVIIPMGAQPGVMQLRMGSNSYTTRSALTLEEPLENGAKMTVYTDFANKINSVTTTSSKLYILTDEQTSYLSNIARVVFAGDEAEVAYDADAITAAGGEDATTDAELLALAEKVDFVRGAHLIIVTIPASAKSGEVNLYDSNDDRFLAAEVEIAQSVAQSITPATEVIPGTTRLTVTGEHFDLVTKVVFTGNIEVSTDELDANEDPLLTIAADGKSLTVMTRIGMQDGPLALHTKSGDVIATPSVTTILPNSLSAWAENDRYKAGQNMTLSCAATTNAATNYLILTQIEQVLFYKADGSTIAAAFEANDTYKCLNITVPDEAVDGKIDIMTYAGKSSTAVETLTLVKPLFTAFGSTSVNPGEAFTIKGSDLDLIRKVELGGVELEFKAAQDGTSLEVQTLATLQGGRVVMTLANGTTLAPDTDLTVNAPSVLTVTNLPLTTQAGGTVTLEGVLLDQAERLYVGSLKIRTFSALADKLTFTLPDEVADGEYAVKIYDRDDVLYEVGTLTVSSGQKTVKLWSGSFDTVVWALQLVEAAQFADLPEDAVYTATFDAPYESGAQLTFKNPTDWSALLSATPSDPKWGCYTIQEGERSYSFTLSADDLAKVQANGMYLSGQKVVITSLSVTYSTNKETVVWDTPTVLAADWSVSVRLDSGNGFDVSVFASCTTQTVFTVYFTDNADNAQIQIKNSSWNPLVSANDPTSSWEGEDIAADQSSYSFSLSAEGLATLKAGGMIIGGKYTTVTKVTFN